MALDDRPRPRMRSWLFAPGDSPRKMEKAADGAADIVLLDLEDAVAEAAKPDARRIVADFLAARCDDRARLWVRVNPLDGPHTLADLVAVVPGAGGIMLPKARGRGDLEQLDHFLSALEVKSGAAPGTTRVIVLAIETAEAMFTAGGYKGAPRLEALTWGAEDLAASLGASGSRDPDGAYGLTYRLARSLTLIGAVAAGVPAIETIHGDFRDLEGLERRARAVRREGFRGMLAIHPGQVEIINAAFTASADELAEAQEIVDLFAANPAAGVVALRGSMLDLPHLARARQVLGLGAR